MNLDIILGLILFFAYVLGLPIFLHEFGHWMALKYYRIPFKIKIFWKWGGIGFQSDEDSLNGLKVCLAGAFPPLLILIPCYFWGSITLFFISFFVCLWMALWTCFETWLNIRMFQKDGKKIS